MTYVTEHESPVGLLTLASDGESITGLWIEGQKHFLGTITGQTAQESALPVFSAAREWLDLYFSGAKTSPDTLPLKPGGTEFQRLVCRELCGIPHGAVTSYGAIAQKIRQKHKRETSARAVGGAVARNPISIIIPCHRVLGADGSITGYAAGSGAKLRLLALEGALLF